MEANVRSSRVDAEPVFPEKPTLHVVSPPLPLRSRRRAILRHLHGWTKWWPVAAAVLAVAVAGFWVGRISERNAGRDGGGSAGWGRGGNARPGGGGRNAGSAASTSAGMSAEGGSTSTAGDATTAALRDTLLHARGSVYAVCQRGKHGGLTAIATAWSVGPSLLATAGHVAEVIHDSESEEDASAGGKSARDKAERDEAGESDEDESKDGPPQFVVRALTADAEAVQITGVRIHPGYERWSGVAERGVLRSGAEGTTDVQFVAPADVALLEVAGEVGPPLPLASQAELEQLSVGDAVGYIGYPAVTVRFDPLRTPATVYLGHVQGLTTPFSQEAGPEDELLIQHDLVNTGGASGSPIFGPSGKVVGIHTASVTSGPFWGAGPLGIHFAQRLDYLHELLDGDAAAAQAERDVRWRAELAGATAPPERVIADFVDERVKEMIAEREADAGAAGELVGEGVEVLAVGLDAGNTFQVPVQPGYTYGFLACALDWSDIDAEVQLAGQDERDDVDDYYPAVWLTPRKRGTATFRVFAEQTTTAETLIYVRTYRIKHATAHSSRAPLTLPELPVHANRRGRG